MRTINIIAGMSLLLTYYDDPVGYHSGAEHDEIYMYPTDRPLTPDDVQKMIDLGWHQEYDERDYDEDFAVRHYRPDEAWVAYA